MRIQQELLGLSDKQISDTLYLRRLYLTKRGLLAIERSKLMSEMHEASSPETAIPTARESLDKLCGLASKLQQNAIEDYQIYIKVAAAVRRGVSNLSRLFQRKQKRKNHAFLRDVKEKLMVVISFS